MVCSMTAEIERVARELSKLDAPYGVDQFDLLSAERQKLYRIQADTAIKTIRDLDEETKRGSDE